MPIVTVTIDALVEAGILCVVREIYCQEECLIYSYKKKDGTVPSQDFIKKAGKKAAATYDTMFKTVLAGNHLRGDRFHKTNNEGLLEFKDNATKTRLFCTRGPVRNLTVLLCGITGKKENRIKPGDVKRANDMKNEYHQRAKEVDNEKR